MSTHDEAFTDALARVLFALDTGRLSTAAVTRAITRGVVRWAHERGWTVRTEARVDLRTQPSGDRLGFVDIIVRRGGELPDVAIEIDSTDKPWSVVKLQHAAAAGMHAIWVRWGDDAWAGVYAGIDVVQLHVARRAAARSATDQVRLWR